MVFYIVLVEGDDMIEFVVDEICLIFDGYIILLWKLVVVNYYFVIDVLCLVSRVMN